VVSFPTGGSLCIYRLPLISSPTRSKDISRPCFNPSDLQLTVKETAKEGSVLIRDSLASMKRVREKEKRRKIVPFLLQKKKT
jgi:hypothetical protein